MLKKFATYYKPHIKYLILDLVSVLVFSAIDIIYPIITKEIINGKVETVLKLLILGGALLVLYSLRYLFKYFVIYYGHVLGQKIENDMREELFSKLEDLDYAYFDDKKSGELLTNLTNHLNEISEASHHAIEDVMSAFLIIIGSFVVCFIVNYKLTLIVFTGVIVLFLFTLFNRRKMTIGFRNYRHEQGELNSIISSSLTGIQLTKAYNNEEFEKEKFKKVNDDYYKARNKVLGILAFFHSTSDFLVNITNLILLITGGIMYIERGVEFLPELIMFFLYVNFIISPVRSLSNTVESATIAWSGYERFYKVMETKNEIVDKDNAIIPNSIKGKIEFKNVTFSYKKETHDVLKDFNLVINPGKRIAIVGETGVGKSTISKIIPRFYDVHDGEVLIDDKNIKDYNLKSLRSFIGHVQQDVFIFFGSIKENIRYGNPKATDEEIYEAARKANISEFIESLPDKYETLCGERGIMLSGGQKQRISIARIFLKNPSILILDEATSALDNITEKLIQKSFDELSVGKTTILIAHRLTTIQDADEIVVLGKYGIIERGTHKELMSLNGEYAKMSRQVNE